MIKNFKTFDINVVSGPIVGDYIIYSVYYDPDFRMISGKQNIGKIKIINPGYYLVSNNSNTENNYVNTEDIEYYSDDKEELKIIINSNKFNI